MEATIPFVDLRAQYRSIRDEVRMAIERVLESGQFILGETVEQFEQHFAGYLGTTHAIGVGSGLDALRLALEGIGVQPRDEVIIPANTYIATALAVSAVGATPVLVDCLEDTYQIDPELIVTAITPRTKAIIPVHLYGQSANMASITAVAKAYGLDLIEDAAQAHGARFAGSFCGTLGRAGCFSFYPAKNLGAYGDGGMVVTGDDEVAQRIHLLRNYGQRTKNEHVVKGMNSRLDPLQAAVLSVKLRYLDRWNARRAAYAARYSQALAGQGVRIPMIDPRGTHVFHTYIVRTLHRDELQAYLAHRGIQTGIHYPLPIHLQAAYRELGYRAGAFPVAERVSREILSLPMYAELTESQIDLVANAVVAFTSQKR
ncbi:DegT/DnrJ/EryC1/StrS family aminotransferase [Candidatus Methylomirabilis sp.]|uniref:DegT/DnrJ/EryC1/StrS family aminotransferase n=1 Tax=Candidatus Methylomirabilis sp. TaxID=2032687 RepID=UPI002A665C11|nr:DegT/DnrJ/EryC1/StrS family aminotransferase [Candidatus Methylomirabilis sp.]